MPYVELVQEVHALLDGTWRAMKEIRDEHGGEPAPGSIAVSEIESDETGPDGQPWGTEPAQTAFSFATMANFAAADHLGALAVLIDPTELGGIFGPLVLARAAIEAAARSWWMLDPDIGVRGRVGRSFRVRLRSIDESSHLVRELLAGVDVREADGLSTNGRPRLELELETLRLRRIEVLRQADERGIPLHTEAGSPSGINVAMPKNDQLVGDLLAESSSMGAAMYALLSGVTHATPSALQQFFDVVESGAPGIVHLEPVFSDDSLLSVATLVLGGQFAAFGRLVHLYGWNQERWSAWVREAQRAAVDLGTRLDNTRAAADPPPAVVGKVGRNDPCPCGSGTKFKFCHGLG